MRWLGIAAIAAAILIVAGSSASAKPLKKVGVKASQATWDGDRLSVRTKAKRKIKLRLAVLVDGKAVTSWKVKARKGTHAYRHRVAPSLMSDGRLQLQVTGKRGGRQGKGVIAIKRIGGVVVSPTPTPTSSAVPTTTATFTPAGTDTPTPTATATDTPTSSATATSTATMTATATVTGTATTTVTATATSTATATPVNGAPTNITLTPSSVAENQPTGTAVGTLGGADPDNDPLTFSLVAGTGADDNGSFTISGAQLQTKGSLDFEAKSSYAIRVSANDGHGNTFEKALTVTVTDLNETPTDLTLSSTQIDANAATGTVVGTLGAVDPDAGATFTFALVSGTGSDDNAAFSVVGTQLQVLAPPDFAGVHASGYKVRLQVSDGTNTFQRAFVITKTPFAATDDTFDAAKRAVGNTTLVVDDPTDAPPSVTEAKKVVTGDILANDTGPGTLTVTTGGTTSGGGTVTMQTDGDFVYRPKAGCSAASDTFTYTLHTSAEATTATGTVTIAIAGCVWYVDAAAGAGGTGTSAAPFNAVAGLSAAAAGDTLFLFGGTYGAVALKSTQTLYTLRSGLTVPNGGGAADVTLVAPGAAHTTVSGLALAPNTTVQGLDISGTTSGLTGTMFGTATIDTVTSGSLTTTAGSPAVLSGGTAAMAFSSISGGQLTLINVDGSFSGAGGTVGGVLISGGSANVTYDGSVARDTAGLVTVAGATGGTKDFNGFVDDGNNGTGTGVSLNSNPGATVRFDGGLRLSTGANAAFSATGTGTVVVTDPAGQDNTIATTTGVPVTIDNVRIGGDGVTLQSVASAGAADGIRLDTTGAGPFSVTGTAAVDSGGTVSASTGPGVSLTGAGGKVTLNRMKITGGGDDGIRAATLTGGIDVTNSTVGSNGNAAGEHGLDYTDVTGASSLQSSSVTGSAVTGMRLVNNVAGTATVSVTGSTIGSNSPTLGANGLELDAEGTAVLNASVTGTTLLANRNDAFLMTNTSGTPAMNLHFDNNTISGGNSGALAGQPGVVVAPSAAAVVKAELNGNGITGMIGRSMIIGPDTGSTAAASFDATIANNQIGNATANSGSAQGDGMLLRDTGAGDARFSVTANTIKNFNQNGIWMRASDGTGAGGNPVNADFTVTGNTIASPTAGGSQGIFVSSGATAADNAVLCADIGGTTAPLKNALGGTGTGGNKDVAFSRRFATDLRLVGFSTGGDVQASVQSRNTGAPTVANVDDALTGQAGACTQPTTPP